MLENENVYDELIDYALNAFQIAINEEKQKNVIHSLGEMEEDM